MSNPVKPLTDDPDALSSLICSVVFFVFQMKSLVPLGRMGEPAGQWTLMFNITLICFHCRPLFSFWTDFKCAVLGSLLKFCMQVSDSLLHQLKIFSCGIQNTLKFYLTVKKKKYTHSSLLLHTWSLSSPFSFCPSQWKGKEIWMILVYMCAWYSQFQTSSLCWLVLPFVLLQRSLMSVPF